MKLTETAFLATIIFLATPSFSQSASPEHGEDFSFADVEKIGRSSDGTYIALCKDGSTENGLTFEDLMTGNVCPSNTAPKNPFAFFKSISAGGDSCDIGVFDNYSRKTVEFGEPLHVHAESKKETQACMTIALFTVAKNHRIAFKKIKYSIENTTSKSSEYKLSIAANKIVYELNIPATASKSLSIELPEVSYTKCATKASEPIDNLLYSVLRRIKGVPNEGIKINGFSIEDFRVEKC